MAFQTSKNKLFNTRHRIQEITVQPATSERATRLKLFVDGRNVHELSTIKPGQTLRWDMQTYPCDVHSGSVIGLKLIEKHYMSPDREVLVEYAVSETVNQTSITKDAGVFPSGLSTLGLVSRRSKTARTTKSLAVAVKFTNLSQIESNHSATFIEAAKMAGEAQGPLDKLGNYRGVLKTILSFGAAVAELYPTARLVIGVFTTAWEYLEKLQEQHEDLQRLIDGLTQMQPFINSVRDRAKEVVLDRVVLGLLQLIEDTSNYIINSMNQTNAGRIMQGLGETIVSDCVSELLQKFGDLKEQFDRGVNVQILNRVLSTEQRAVINQLKPIPLSLSMPPPCHKGTRVQPIADICAWYDNANDSQNLLWLYGQAGMGKSSIAASVCQVFHDAGTLGAHFFFRRDDPYLRSPEHMLNIIVHRLAFQYEPYGRAVASAIEEYSGVLDMPLGQRYVHLVERPLQSLVLSAESPPRTLAIVVDALDECESTNSRRPLFTYLREMSRLVPWIKIVIMSRPDADIAAAFDCTNYSYIASRSIASYDASSDILMYTRMRMDVVANRKKQPRWSEDSVQELAARAAGLFIWVETACKLIERGADMKTRLEQVLAGTQSAEDSGPLDVLYTTAIEQGMGDQKSDNVRMFRECIGAIVATGNRTPLSVADLELLLSGHASPGLFRTVVNGLGSVLYEDENQRGAVRVYHPSFADFMLDPSRSGRFYTDPHKQNTVLADCSLRTMMRELRFNICDLETSHIPNRNVPGLKARVETTIRPHLAYSCLHWSSHLTETPSGTLQDLLSDFLYGRQLLYWIEAMSLLGQASAALSSLLELIDWTSDTMKDHSSYANDAYRFILTFYDAISQSTPHLYISALPFAPTRSMLAQRMRPLFPNMLVAALNTNEGWSTWLQSMPHNSVVESIACSANGRCIVSGCRDGTVRIWDSETGAAISEPLGSPGVSRVAISSDGQRVASGSGGGTLRVWDVETGVALFDPWVRHGGYLLFLVFSSDGSQLFSMSSDYVLVWDINTRAQLSKLLLDHSDDMNAAAISSDKQLIASCSANGTVRIWDTKTGAPLTEPLLGHSASVDCVAFSPNGRIVATGSKDTTVRIWEVSTGRALYQPMTGHSSTVRSVAFSPDGRYIISGSSDMTVRVWSVETGTAACNPLLGHTSRVYSVAFCSNNQRAVSASGDKTVLVWDVGTDVTASRSPVGHMQPVNSVAFSSDSRYVISGSDDGSIRIWDAQCGDQVFTPLTGHSRPVDFVAFIPNSRRIISVVGRKTVQIQEVECGTLVASFPLSNIKDVLSIALSPDGRWLASSSGDGRVGLWDTGTGLAPFEPIAAHSDRVRAVVFSPDGRFFASGSEDSTIRIWEVESGIAVGEPLIGLWSWVQCVCFSPDNRRIASGFNDGTVQVWDRETGVALIEPIRGHLYRVRSILFTPNGRHIISASGDATVRIWDAETGAPIAEPLNGHSDGVFSIALTPNGRRIATGSNDSTVRIWDMEDLRTHDQLLIDELFVAPPTRSISTPVLAHHANKAGWVTSGTGTLLLWLPKQRQRTDDSLIQISIVPTPDHVLLDFSKFVHGVSWTSVAGA